jgi:hypothetical protein
MISKKLVNRKLQQDADIKGKFLVIDLLPGEAPNRLCGEWRRFDNVRGEVVAIRIDEDEAALIR